MPSFETLDAIADAHNPVLILVSLGTVLACLFKAQWRAAGQRAGTFLVIAVVAYGLMFLDRKLGVWSSLGLDYSTHTAVALGVVLFLCVYQRRLAPVWCVSLGLYALLMLYQGYHSVADILTTAVAVGVPMGLFLKLVVLPRQAASQPVPTPS